MKLKLSRPAKKVRESEPKQPATPKPAKSLPPVKPPAAEKVEPVNPPVVTAPEPVPPAPALAPQAKKVRPVKAKRPRFVRAMTEKRERPALPPLPPPSTRLAARLLTKNLTLPPKDEATTFGR